MDEIDGYLGAHAKYVEALEAIDSIGTLLRDVGDQLLANPLNVQFDEDRVILSGPVNGRGDGPGKESAWPSTEQIRKALNQYQSSKEVLVEQGKVLVDARAPEDLKSAFASSR